MSRVENAIEAAGFSAFARLLRAGPFAELLESGGPYTIFAPTDAAFEKFPNDDMDGDTALSRAVAGYHFAPGKVMSQRFLGKRIRAVMHSGGSFIIDGRAGLRADTANIVQPDIIAGACVIHGIDGVLWPREPVAAAL